MEQILGDNQPLSTSQPQDYNPPLKIKIICSYLYFIQGIIISLPATMTLIYKDLPSYGILGLFAAATLPFSFKFILAPFEQKFANINYGKRKTWIIVSQIMTSLTIFVCSFLTSSQTQVPLAIMFMFSILFVTLQDISLDAMAIKQMKVPQLVGRTQAIMQTFGFVVGGLIFLKGCSNDFASSIGLTAPITSPAILLRIFSLSVLIPTIIIHFQYKETILESQRQVADKSFFDILKYYRIFLDRKSRYCRTALMFMFFVQGFNFFTAGYEYQLVQGGFKKNTINTINNISLIPVSIIILLISSKITEKAWLKFELSQMIARWVLYVLLLATFPTLTQDTTEQQLQQYITIKVQFVSVVILIIQFLDTLHFLLTSILVNCFPVVGVSGMYITFLNSSANFGSLKALHLKLIDFFGWKACSAFGLALQIVIIILLPKIFKTAYHAELLGSKQCIKPLQEEIENLKELDVIAPKQQNTKNNNSEEPLPKGQIQMQKYENLVEQS